MLALVLTAAIVVEDPAVLRATGHDSAPPQAQVWRGDWLEVRGERGGFLQVWDHRRERAGYVRATQVRAYRVGEAEAPALRAVIDFVRDAPGMESLGIGYVALFLKAAPAAQVGAEVFDALGPMAERLARRAPLRPPQAGTCGPAGHREIAAE